MSYEPNAVVHNNSRQTCVDYTDLQIPKEQYTSYAGNRGYADSAYHLNRVRYDVSLVNCASDNKCQPATARSMDAVEVEQSPIIADSIERFPDGQAMAEREMRWLEAQLKAL